MAHLITTFYRPVIQTPLVFALVIYLALTGMTVMLWWLLPLWFLGGFLAYSAYHFGDSDWPDQGTMWKWAWGLSLVGLPCLLTPQAVQPLFAVIAGVTEICHIKVTGLLSIPATILCCLPHRQPEGRHQSQTDSSAELRRNVLDCRTTGCIWLLLRLLAQPISPLPLATPD